MGKSSAPGRKTGSVWTPLVLVILALASFLPVYKPELNKLAVLRSLHPYLLCSLTAVLSAYILVKRFKAYEKCIALSLSRISNPADVIRETRFLENLFREISTRALVNIEFNGLFMAATLKTFKRNPLFVDKALELIEESTKYIITENCGVGCKVSSIRELCNTVKAYCGDGRTTLILLSGTTSIVSKVREKCEKLSDADILDLSRIVNNYTKAEMATAHIKKGDYECTVFLLPPPNMNIELLAKACKSRRCIVYDEYNTCNLRKCESNT